MEQEKLKELLFNYIKINENKFSKLILQHKFSEIIDHIMIKFYDDKADVESLAVLATGILHYLLTRTLVPSQRKITLNEIKLDIVIPDIKTLKSNPKDALILYILQTQDEHLINKKLKQLNTIQPTLENIWLVSTKNITIKKTYLFSVNGSFHNIIDDIKKFVKNGKNRFKIVGN